MQSVYNTRGNICTGIHALAVVKSAVASCSLEKELRAGFDAVSYEGPLIVTW